MAVTPTTLADARFDPLIQAPPGTALAPNATAGLRIVIDAAADLKLAEPLRVFIDGEPSFCGALRDTLFMRVSAAYIEAGDGPWIALPRPPIVPVGFAEHEALIPFCARSHLAYRQLLEYFAFPDKFNFFDIDLAAIGAQLPPNCQRLTLHLAVTGLRPDSSVARMLRTLSRDNLLLSCSPVVNLFTQPGVPISVTQVAADYAVLAHPVQARAFEVYSIDSVHMLRQSEHAAVVTEFRPFYALRHGEGAANNGHYWVMRRDLHIAETSPGHESRITLVDADTAPLAIESSSLSVMLTCTNRDLPAMLACGHSGGDFVALPSAAGNPVRLLRRPSPAVRFASPHGNDWRLVSKLTLNHQALSSLGLDAFREMLTLNDVAQSPVSLRQIRGVTGLTHAETSIWRRGPRGVALVYGIEVRLTLDEEAFVGSGMHLFIQVIDQFFGLYVQLNSFVELVVLSKKTGEELMRCQPRKGSLGPASSIA